MIVKQLVVGQLQTNCYLAACDQTKEGVVIDPGDDSAKIIGEIETHGLTIKYVLITHAHFDHIGANESIVHRTGAPLALHPLDMPLLKEQGGASLFGVQSPQSPEPDIALEEGQIIAFGTNKLKVLLTPGHTPGHVSFYEAHEGVVFDGDVLFDGGIGRTDMPGGDSSAILTSIKEVLFKLPDDTIVYSGHGNPTTIGQEKTTNPWTGMEFPFSPG